MNHAVNLTDPSGNIPWLAAAALYGAGYLGYDYIDTNYRESLPWWENIGWSVIGYATGYEQIQQDLRTLKCECASMAEKTMALADLALNAGLGITQLSWMRGVSTTGRWGAGTVMARRTNRFYRHPRTKLIEVPANVHGARLWGGLSHEIAHVAQEFAVRPRQLRQLNVWLQNASVWSTSNLTPINFIPKLYLYFLNPIEAHAAVAGLRSPSNIVFFLGHRGTYAAPSGVINKVINHNQSCQ